MKTLEGMKYIHYFMVVCIAFGCGTNDAPFDTSACVTGIIVGNKCTAFAFQLDKKGTLGRSLGAQKWERKDPTTGERAYFDNVIGLLELPDAYKQVGKRVFLHIRPANQEESFVPCTTDMPNPPSPRYIVLKASVVRCP